MLLSGPHIKPGLSGCVDRMVGEGIPRMCQGWMVTGCSPQVNVRQRQVFVFMGLLNLMYPCF